MSIEICPRCDGSGYERSARIERCQDCEGRGYASALIVRTEPIPAEWRAEFIDTQGLTRYTLEAWACSNGALTLGEIARRAGISTTQVADVLNVLGVQRVAVELHVAGFPVLGQLERHMRDEFGRVVAAAVKFVSPSVVEP